MWTLASSHLMKSPSFQIHGLEASLPAKGASDSSTVGRPRAATPPNCAPQGDFGKWVPPIQLAPGLGKEGEPQAPLPKGAFLPRILQESDLGTDDPAVPVGAQSQSQVDSDEVVGCILAQPGVTSNLPGPASRALCRSEKVHEDNGRISGRRAAIPPFREPRWAEQDPRLPP